MMLDCIMLTGHGALSFGDHAYPPNSATVSIDGVVYGKGLGSSKKHAKTEAALQTLEILIPDFKEALGEDIAGASNSSSTELNELPDVSFFDSLRSDHCPNFALVTFVL